MDWLSLYDYVSFSSGLDETKRNKSNSEFCAPGVSKLTVAIHLPLKVPWLLLCNCSRCLIGQKYPNISKVFKNEDTEQTQERPPRSSLWPEKSVNRRLHLAVGDGCLPNRCKITQAHRQKLCVFHLAWVPPPLSFLLMIRYSLGLYSEKLLEGGHQTH